jgi:CDP-paratose 2-epimerase
VEFIRGDVREAQAVEAAARGVGCIFHLAGQVAVTTSVTDPRSDFEVNALGTLNVLEAARKASEPVPVLLASTNKVYGGLDGLRIIERDRYYGLADGSMGVDETWPLDFHSPYGCSKGCADQYVRDYSRIYGLPTVVFRMSCIYGPRQFGTEDQGWVAHFMISAALGKNITIYGDGKQSRDILHVDDVVRAMLGAVDRITDTAGGIYNLGGGPGNRLSLLELLADLGGRIQRPLAVKYAEWRPGDQRVYVSDIRRAQHVFGWSPSLGVRDGLDRLWSWIEAHAEEIRAVREQASPD